MTEHSEQHLVDLILTGADRDGAAASQLLRTIQQHGGASRLLPLCEGDDGAASAAAWILSELGVGASGMLTAAADLLRHPARKARFYALDVVLVCAGEQHGPLIAQASRLLSDPDPVVRWKAMRFLSRADAAQLVACIDSLADQRARHLLTWVLETSEPAALTSISERLGSQDALTRAHAVIAASRRGEQALLVAGAVSEDPDISGFAQSELDLPSQVNRKG